MSISYHDRKFKGVENYDSGDLNEETRFHYYQNEKAVWGTLNGGGAVQGMILAKIIEDDILDMVWSYINKEGEFISGICESKPELLPDGRLRLHETWFNSTTGEQGSSVIEEEKE